MKVRNAVLVSIILAAAFLWACSKEDEKDTEKPVISMDSAAAFPKPCDTIFRGEIFVFRAEFSDNVAMGSYNLELHHNFDHHTHGSHVETCDYDPDKEPLNPFYFNESFPIPAGSETYTAEKEILIPEDSETGDYHFMVKLTDKEGWQSWQSVSVKIGERGK